MEEVMNFVTVLVVAVVIAGGIGTMYATGLRLWARSAAAEQEGSGFMGLSHCFRCLFCCLYSGGAVCTVAHDSNVPLGC